MKTAKKLQVLTRVSKAAGYLDSNDPEEYEIDTVKTLLDQAIEILLEDEEYEESNSSCTKSSSNQSWTDDY